MIFVNVQYMEYQPKPCVKLPRNKFFTCVLCCNGVNFGHVMSITIYKRTKNSCDYWRKMIKITHIVFRQENYKWNLYSSKELPKETIEVSLSHFLQS